mgnify:CR=1 FL=1|tara:strand:- start:8201 stop:8695 length:495 start_codon:yes stop_codon:yes gene_type:complete
MKSLKVSLYLALTLLTILNCSKAKTTPEVAPIITDVELSVQIHNEFYQFIKKDSNWSGTKKIESQSTSDLIAIQPKQGWDEFELILNHFEILDLPNQSDTKGNMSTKLSSISQKYYFTVNYNDETRSFEYINPEANLLNSWEAQSVVSFGTYITTEFTQTPLTK